MAHSNKTSSLSIRECIDTGAKIVFKRPIDFILTTIIYSLIVVGINAITFFGQIAGAVVLPILSMGMLIIAHNTYTEKRTTIGVLFNGFSGRISDRLVISFVFMIINTILLGLYFGITYFIIEGKVDDGSSLFSSWTGSFFRIMYLNILVFLALAYTQIIFMFSLLQTYLNDLKASEAMQAAMAMVKGEFWKLLLLSLILLFMNAIGATLLFAGLLITLPISFAALYVAYLRLSKAELDTDLTEEPTV